MGLRSKNSLLGGENPAGFMYLQARLIASINSLASYVGVLSALTHFPARSPLCSTRSTDGNSGTRSIDKAVGRLAVPILT